MVFQGNQGLLSALILLMHWYSSIEGKWMHMFRGCLIQRNQYWYGKSWRGSKACFKSDILM